MLLSVGLSAGLSVCLSAGLRCTCYHGIVAIVEQQQQQQDRQLVGGWSYGMLLRSWYRINLRINCVYLSLLVKFRQFCHMSLQQTRRHTKHTQNLFASKQMDKLCCKPGQWQLLAHVVGQIVSVSVFCIQFSVFRSQFTVYSFPLCSFSFSVFNLRF